MKRVPTLISVVVLCLPLLWSGSAGIDRVAPGAPLSATRVALDPADPARTRLGALTFIGGLVLASPDPAFGGYSALRVDGDRFTLLSDGGGILRFRMGADWRPRGHRFTDLPAGPATGWTKRERDSESLAVDPAGRIWVGFESYNAIWRYPPGFAGTGQGVAPAAMAGWDNNGGIESFARLADGRFVAISETTRPAHGDGGRDALVWAGDPVADPQPAYRFVYWPARGFDPADMTQLPDGRIVVLERRFRLPFRWSNRLVVIDRAAIRPGAMVTGREIARLETPVLHDNFEGIAATREGGATMLWLVSDDNQLVLQRSLLLKFRLDD